MKKFAQISLSSLVVGGLLSIVGCAAQTEEETATSEDALSKLSCTTSSQRVASLAACQQLVASTASVPAGATGQSCADGAPTTTKYSDCEDLGFKGLITVEKTVCKCNAVPNGVWSIVTSEQQGFASQAECQTGCTASSLPTAGTACAPIGSTGTPSCSCTPSGFGSGGPTGWKRFFAKPVCSAPPPPAATYAWVASSYENYGYASEAECKTGCVQTTLPQANASCSAAEANSQKKSCSCTPSGFGPGGPTGWKQYYSVRTCRAQ